MKNNIKKVQAIQNITLYTATICTQDISTLHLHDETSVLPMGIHLKLDVTQLKQLTQTQTHFLRHLNSHSD